MLLIPLVRGLTCATSAGTEKLEAKFKAPNKEVREDML